MWCQVWYDMRMATDYKRCSVFLSEVRVVALARGLSGLKSFFLEPIQEFRERDRMLRPHRWVVSMCVFTASCHLFFIFYVSSRCPPPPSAPFRLSPRDPRVSRLSSLSVCMSFPWSAADSETQLKTSQGNTATQDRDRFSACTMRTPLTPFLRASSSLGRLYIRKTCGTKYENRRTGGGQWLGLGLGLRSPPLKLPVVAFDSPVLSQNLLHFISSAYMLRNPWHYLFLVFLL